jgi:hypothetical protein
MREYVYDPVRKKRVALTPEEDVRQQLIRELSTNHGYPLHLMSCEYSLSINKLCYRGDLVVFNREGAPVMLVECKAPEVGISKDTFLQILRYNVALKVTYLLLTNGLDAFMAKIETKTGEYTFLTSIPEYNEISK